MAKFFGVIGFAETKETKPGVWREVITPRKYYGDITRNLKRYETSDKVVDNINISNTISIVADPYMNNNLASIKYVEFAGSKWKVSDAESVYPRILLTIGGVYNE